jgi:ketosteroid isomerase-like protein
MKRLIAIAMVFAGGMLQTSVTLADDVDDVKAAVLAYYAALNSGDVNAWVQLHLPGRTSFGPDGGLLVPATSLEEQRKNYQAQVDAGRRYNLQARHLDVQLYGDAAVTTNYSVGSVALPNGTPQAGTARVSRMWIKQVGQWKIAHVHVSPLAGSPRE